MKDYLSFNTKDMVQRRPIKRGEIILMSEPFAHILDNHHQGQYCDHCIASSRDKTLVCCKGCNFVWYCNEVCMFAGFEMHKDECKALQRLHPFVPPSFTLLVARVMNKLKRGGEKYIEYFSDHKGRKFKDLMNHYRDIKDDDKRMKDVRNNMKILKKMLGEDNFPNESDFIGIYGRILVNRFCLMDSFMSPIGTSLYLAGSIFDHSCQPNAYPSFIGKKLVVRSLVDWKEFDFNKVFICYIDIVSSTNQRRADLRANWYFWCYCSLCVCKERALYENCIKCENPFCGANVQVPEKALSIFQSVRENKLECQECACLVDEDTIDEYQSAVAYTRQRLRGLSEDNISLETVLAILEKQGSLFSPMNVWRVRSVDFIFNAAYYQGMWLTALNYGKDNLNGMRYYYGEEHPTYGLFLMKLGKVFLYLKFYREGLKLMEDAEKLLIPAFGKDHPMVAEEIQRLKIIANEDLDILLERRIEAKKKEEHEAFCKHCGKRKKPLINKQPAVEEDEEIDFDDLAKRMEEEKQKIIKQIETLRNKKYVVPVIESDEETTDEEEEEEEEEEEVEKENVGNVPDEIVIGKRKDQKLNGHIDYSANSKYLKFLFPVK